MSNSKKDTSQIPSSLPPCQTTLSMTSQGFLAAYASCTSVGTHKSSNEDRISLIPDIKSIVDRNDRHDMDRWPQCAYFAVFDGHGGSRCATWLQQNLHKVLVKDWSFPSDPKQALIRAFQVADDEIIRSSDDDSGSCANVVLIVGSTVYCANVGDSRAVMSLSDGARLAKLSRDHNPHNQNEKKRVLQAGGNFYRSKKYTSQGHSYQGTKRVNPGRLSITRAFGNKLAKETHSGLPGVIIPRPSVKQRQLNSASNFIVIASDGVFFVLNNDEVVGNVIESMSGEFNAVQKCRAGAQGLIHESILRKSNDNVSAVVISLKYVDNLQ